MYTINTNILQHNVQWLQILKHIGVSYYQSHNSNKSKVIALSHVNDEFNFLTFHHLYISSNNYIIQNSHTHHSIDNSSVQLHRVRPSITPDIITDLSRVLRIPECSHNTLLTFVLQYSLSTLWNSGIAVTRQ